VKDVLDSLEAWRAEGQPVARAVVVRTYGSAPRREGATMLLAGDGRLAGSVSGGCVEGATADLMSDSLISGRQRLVRFGVSDEQAWSVGLACGGVIDVLLQPSVPEAALEGARAAWSPRRAGSGGDSGGPSVAAAGPGAASVVVTTLPVGAPEDASASRVPRAAPPGIGSTSGSAPRPAALPETGSAAPPDPPLVVRQDGRLDGTLGSREADDALVEAALAALHAGTSTTLEIAGALRFLEVFAVRPRLVIVGGVPIAMTLVRLARELGFETVVIDARARFATPERFPDVDRLLVAWPDEAAAQIGLAPPDAVVVLSHDPKFDEPAIAEALRRGCRYVGAIGSRRTQRARRERLLAEGLGEADIARLHGPIGLDLGGRETGEVALAILAEVVAARHGASARPMSGISAGASPAAVPAE
jgi:xanthine dehydrogenase accessory factor